MKDTHTWDDETVAVAADVATVEAGPVQSDILDAAERGLRESVELLALTMEDVRQGRFEEIRTVGQAVQELRKCFNSVMEERSRVEKLRRQVSGAVHGRALDLGAARDEIGRRLACLRDAGGGG